MKRWWDAFAISPRSLTAQVFILLWYAPFLNSILGLEIYICLIFIIINYPQCVLILIILKFDKIFLWFGESKGIGTYNHNHNMASLALKEFIENFSETRPCVLSRSLAQVLYLGGGDKLWGGQTMAEALREAARGFICPPALLPKAPVMNNVQVCLTHQMDSFLMMNLELSVVYI